MKPRPVKSNGRLEVLLRKAAVLMAREGYHHTSMRDVAKTAKCSLAGLYHYFTSKEDLLFQIQRDIFASLLEEQEQSVRRDETLEDQMRTLVRNHLAFFTRHAAELKICTFELESLGGPQYREVAEIRGRYYRLMSKLVTGLMARRGPVSEAETRRVTLLIFGMLNWIFMWFDPKRDGPVDRLGDEIVGLVLHGLCGERAVARRRHGS